MIVLALIQARMGSTRFPAKVLSDVLGKPMLLWQLERLRKSKELSRVVVATSDLPADDAIANFCKKIGQPFFRGSEASVLDRFHAAGLSFLSESEKKDAVVVRLTGDCPLSDPFLIDEGIREFHALRGSGCRYFGYEDSMPDGMDFEVFTWQALDEVFHEQTDSFEKEHATPFMWRNPKRFGVRKFKRDGITPGLRFSVDYEEDRELVEEILKREQSAGRFFGVQEIAALLASDEKLRAINGKIIKNEGLIQTSFKSEKFRVEVEGEFLTAFGVAVPNGAILPDDFLLWSARMGVNAWAASSKDLPYVADRLRGAITKHKLWDKKQIPSDWQIVDGSGDWEQKLLSLTHDSSVKGVLIETADRLTLAAMLMFVVQKRYSI
jgi:spore coat polysaccharide biosynthesis protein SpsF